MDFGCRMARLDELQAACLQADTSFTWQMAQAIHGCDPMGVHRPARPDGLSRIYEGDDHEDTAWFCCTSPAGHGCSGSDSGGPGTLGRVLVGWDRCTRCGDRCRERGATDSCSSGTCLRGTPCLLCATTGQVQTRTTVQHAGAPLCAEASLSEAAAPPAAITAASTLSAAA